jgi:hypothetical protein
VAVEAVVAAGIRILTATGGGACVEAVNVRAMISLAADVPSAPQTGQATGEGIRPLTGSTSKA